MDIAKFITANNVNTPPNPLVVKNIFKVAPTHIIKITGK